MEEQLPKKKFIDLEEVIREKNPRLIKLLPRFLLNYLKRIIHEKEINAFIDAHGHKKDLEFVHSIIDNFGVKVKVLGAENIPAKGGCIFASNHPLGGLDGMALLYAISDVRQNAKLIVNDILLQLKNLQNVFVGVNKHGKTSIQMLDDIEALYSSSNAVIIFPAGLVSRKQKGVIKDLQWKKSFVTKAKKYQRNVIPVYIDAQNTSRFYNLALWRKRMGITANIEMLYLVDEMYRQKNKTITLIFGKPIPHHSFDKIRTDHKWAESVKEQVYAMGKEFKEKQ